MRYRCIISYRTSRSKGISTWRTSIQGKDFISVTAKIVSQLEARQKRPVTVVGLYLHIQKTKTTT